MYVIPGERNPGASNPIFRGVMSAVGFDGGGGVACGVVRSTLSAGGIGPSPSRACSRAVGEKVYGGLWR